MISNSYSALVGKDLLTKELLGLIRGTLQDNAEMRWGFQELDTWLRGRHVKQSKNIIPKKSRRPLRFGGVDHKNLRTVAYSMSTRRDSAIDIIKTGTLENWIENNFEETE